MNPTGSGSHAVGWEGDGIYPVFGKNWQHASPVRRQWRERQMVEFIPLLQRKDHKETNNSMNRQDGTVVVPGVRSSWCCGRARWHLIPSRFPCSLFLGGPVCLRPTVLGITELEAPWRQKPSLTHRPLGACLYSADLTLESQRARCYLVG